MKFAFKIILLAVLAITTTTAGFSQPTSMKSLQRIADEQTVADMADLGLDVAFVIMPGSIQETANVKAKNLLAVKRADILALVNRNPTGNFYNVIQITSGIEGWIDGDAVVVKHSLKATPAPPLVETAGIAGTEPKLDVVNDDSVTTLNIRINGILHIVPPKSIKSFILKPGKFDYFGWSAGIRPAIGSKTVVKGMKYVWKFKIYAT